MKGHIFKGDDGKLYLVRCPYCKMENYAPSVASGKCVWCGYVATIEDTRDNPVWKPEEVR